jgi:hypothetical protein
MGRSRSRPEWVESRHSTPLLFTPPGRWPTLPKHGSDPLRYLVFPGHAGVPVRTGLAHCLATTAILIPLGLAAIDDMPPCDGIGCDYSAPTLALVAVTQIALPLASFGAGIGARKLSKLLGR